jgi:hypothetical protein
MVCRGRFLGRQPSLCRRSPAVRQDPPQQQAASRQRQRMPLMLPRGQPPQALLLSLQQQHPQREQQRLPRPAQGSRRGPQRLCLQQAARRSQQAGAGTAAGAWGRGRWLAFRCFPGPVGLLQGLAATGGPPLGRKGGRNRTRQPMLAVAGALASRCLLLLLPPQPALQQEVVGLVLGAFPPTARQPCRARPLPSTGKSQAVPPAGPWCLSSCWRSWGKLCLCDLAWVLACLHLRVGCHIHSDPYCTAYCRLCGRCSACPSLCLGQQVEVDSLASLVSHLLCRACPPAGIWRAARSIRCGRRLSGSA